MESPTAADPVLPADTALPSYPRSPVGAEPKQPGRGLLIMTSTEQTHTVPQPAGITPNLADVDPRPGDIDPRLAEIRARKTERRAIRAEFAARRRGLEYRRAQ